jgi:predicted permease
MPDWKPAIREQLERLRLEPTRELEIIEEISQHFDDQYKDLVSGGASESEAARIVLDGLQSGNLFTERLAQTQRARRPPPVLGAERGSLFVNLFQDVKYGLRMLRKNRAFTTVAVLTLALGIGANTALFTALDTLMFRPLAARDPSRLVFVTKDREETFSFPFYGRLRESLKSLQGFAASQYRAPKRELLLPGAKDPAEIAAQGVSGNFFSVLGVAPLIGRTFGETEDKPGAAEPIVVISHSFWVARFGSDPNVIGSSVQLDTVPVTIIGVMPPNFTGFAADVKPDLWWPLQLVSRLEQRDRNPMGEGVSWLVLFGRLRDGAALEQAQSEASVFFRRTLEDKIAENPNRPAAERQRILNQTIQIVPGAAGFVSARGEFRQPLIILMAAVGVVLLIACTNIAGLLLARGVSRQREIAIRVALGARRSRIICQLITESLLLAVMGGAAGLLFAQVGASFLSNFISQSNTPLPLAPDWRTFVFTLLASLFAGFLFGFVPALPSARLDLANVVKNQGNASLGISFARFLPFIVVAQVALCVLLLAGAGLFVRTLRNLRKVEFGFRNENLISLSIDPGRTRRDAAQQEMLLRQLLTELSTVPGIRSVSLGGAGLLTGNGINMDVDVEGYTRDPDEETRMSAILAGPAFFDTMQVPILRGRDFNRADEPATKTGEPSQATVAVIGESMARRFFGEIDPVGKRFTVDSSPKVTLQIVGVARDTRYSSDLRRPIPAQFYIPYFGSGIRMPPTFYLRADQPVAGVVDGIREAMARVSLGLKIKTITPMDGLIDKLLLRERIIAQLVSFFSVFSLLLASLGIYGILSFRVAQRTREIGVRVALGATYGAVVSLVVRQGVKLVVVGGIIGVVGSLIATRFVTALLYGVTPADPTTFFIVASLMIASAVIAGWIPARRAAKVDPMVALRCE